MRNTKTYTLRELPPTREEEIDLMMEMEENGWAFDGYQNPSPEEPVAYLRFVKEAA